MPLSPLETLSLDALQDWSLPGTHLAVLGHPIKHSLSPHMHNAALRVMAAKNPPFGDWRYWKFDVAPEQLREALALLHSRRFFGINLTVPHKILALEYIERVDPSAQKIGAVNTLRRTATGYEGFNTDGYGLATGVETTLSVSLEKTDILLLGAGGAARGAAVECIQRSCRSLTIANRSENSLTELLAVLKPLSKQIPLRGCTLNALPADLPKNLLVINATSSGLRDGETPPIDLTTLPPGARVYDMIYNPAQTPLLRDAQRLGLNNTNGLSMLVHQGARALEIWTGAPVPAEEMQRAAETALAAY